MLKASSVRTLLRWLAANGCDLLQIEQAAEDAARQRRLQAELDCVACFPASVHDLFKPAPYGTELPPWEAERGRKLAAAINNPVRLTVMASKAYGCLHDYGYIGMHEGILLNAVTNVSGPDFVAALTEIQADQRALLGASTLFFDNNFPQRLPKKEAGAWTAKLSEVVFNVGQEDRFSWRFEALSRDRSPEVHSLLRRLARGETGKTYTLRGMAKYDPLPKPSAYLCLALQADAEIKPEVENLLTRTTRPEDRAALEVALALLAQTNHLGTEHFQYSSCLLEHGTLEAVRRFPTRENLDALVSGGITRHEAAELFEKLVNHHWPVNARFDGDISRWWQTHRDQFARRQVPN